MLNIKNYMDIYSETELQQVINVITENKTSIIRGGLLEEFEKKCADFLGNKYALSTCNGTSAIYLALYGAGVSSGDEVILPVFAFHAMAVTVCHLGATPVFCDIEKETLTIDLEKLESLITKQTKAVLVLQPWGNLANIDKIVELKKKYPKISFISDSSHAHGALWKDKPLGIYFDAIAMSFGKGKLISGGELGVLTTDNKLIQERAMQFAHVNRVPKDLTIESLKGINNAVGLKMRPHGLALQLGLINLNKFQKYFPILKKNILSFEGALLSISGVTPVKHYQDAQRSFWKFPIFVKETVNTEELLNYLKENGIPAEKNNYERLLCENTIFTDYYHIPCPKAEDFPCAFSVKNRIIQLPECLFYEVENVNLIIDMLKKFTLKDEK